MGIRGIFLKGNYCKRIVEEWMEFEFGLFGVMKELVC